MNEIWFVYYNIIQFYNSQSAIHLSRHHGFHDKHIDVKFHLTIDILEKKILKVSTKCNPVNIGTITPHLHKFRDYLNLLNINTS